jgi:hypothetical protein
MKSSVFEEPAELPIELGERRCFGLVDREVRGLERGLDAERPARGDLLYRTGASQAPPRKFIDRTI